MPQSPELLLLRRALDETTPDDYIDWAVDQISRDVDGPSLRILAGLHRVFDRHEVERYFLLTCEELGVSVGANPSVLRVAQVGRSVYYRGEISAHQAVEMMAALYRMSDCEEELLVPWFDMQEELGWSAGYFYLTDKLEPLDAAVRREWSLLDRALAYALRVLRRAGTERYVTRRMLVWLATFIAVAARARRKSAGQLSGSTIIG